jgi:hypothetical protein
LPRRLLLLNVLLGAVACLLAVALVGELATPHPLPPAPSGRRAQEAAPGPPQDRTSPDPVARNGYAVIATKNLFNPSRSEAPTGSAVATGPKPLLHGVVVDGPKSRAYLEDPVVKRTFGYTVGDTIGGGRLQSISPDRVVISRPDGLVEVLLQDPAKPKPAIPAAVGGAMGQIPRRAAPTPAGMPTPPSAMMPVVPGVPALRLPPAANVPPRVNQR